MKEVFEIIPPRTANIIRSGSVFLPLFCDVSRSIFGQTSALLKLPQWTWKSSLDEKSRHRLYSGSIISVWCFLRVILNMTIAGQQHLSSLAASMDSEDEGQRRKAKDITGDRASRLCLEGLRGVIATLGPLLDALRQCHRPGFLSRLIAASGPQEAIRSMKPFQTKPCQQLFPIAEASADDRGAALRSPEGQSVWPLDPHCRFNSASCCSLQTSIPASL